MQQLVQWGCQTSHLEHKEEPKERPDRLVLFDRLDEQRNER